MTGGQERTRFDVTAQQLVATGEQTAGVPILAVGDSFTFGAEVNERARQMQGFSEELTRTARLLRQSGATVRHLLEARDRRRASPAPCGRAITMKLRR